MAVSCVHATSLPTAPAQVEQCEMKDSIRPSVEWKVRFKKTKQDNGRVSEELMENI